VEKTRILVSACLLGDRVRYDGADRRDAFIVETLERFADLVWVCPEVECGLPVPREPMRLVGDPARPRLLTITTGVDLTEPLERFTRARIEALAPLGLRGFLCKGGSPSCGLSGVRVCDVDGRPRAFVAGLFTRLFREAFPLVPVAEEGHLADPDDRVRFLERVFPDAVPDELRPGRGRA
jgi:uncharacterized protein YbbK (DUF523 family)